MILWRNYVAGNNEMYSGIHVKINRYFVVCFLLGNSPASEFYMPTFRNTLFHLHRRVGVKMEQTECSETSVYTIQTPGNYPEESIQRSEHGESLK